MQQLKAKTTNANVVNATTHTNKQNVSHKHLHIQICNQKNKNVTTQKQTMHKP